MKTPEEYIDLFKNATMTNITTSQKILCILDAIELIQKESYKEGLNEGSKEMKSIENYFIHAHGLSIKSLEHLIRYINSLNKSKI